MWERAVNLTISNIPAISAIYYALLQGGYEYYPLDRDHAHADVIQSFAHGSRALPFFDGARQHSCDVNAFWPRAALLETVTFYLYPDFSEFADVEGFRRQVLSAGNIVPAEKGPAFWAWVKDFPAALRDVIQRSDFLDYLAWENQWIARQNEIHRSDLMQLEESLKACMDAYQSPVRHVRIVLSAIKCVYASDYHWTEDGFLFSSGAFRMDSVLHEFLHHVVHPIVLQHSQVILSQKRTYSGLDASYNLSNSPQGQLNAFEEHLVRSLTAKLLPGVSPPDINAVLMECLAERR